MYWQFGAATDIDILQFDQKTMRLILRCPADFYVKLRAALTVASTYMETDCYYKVLCLFASKCFIKTILIFSLKQVIKAAPCLMQLASNSLLFEHRWLMMPFVLICLTAINSLKALNLKLCAIS